MKLLDRMIHESNNACSVSFRIYLMIVMERPIKIFLSSTYKDLKTTRKCLMDLIRRMGHISKEMESFSAGRRHQWDKIQDELDDSDIVIVISELSYGTLFKRKKSFTEHEVDYAIKTGKPIIPLLTCKNLKKCKDENKASLLKFRDKLERHTPKYFKNTAELVLELVCAIRDVELHPKKWSISDKSSALKKLDNPDDWVVDGEDIYYEPNSDFGISLDNETKPTNSWRKCFETFQADTCLTKEIFDRQKKRLGVNGIDFDLQFYDAKIIRQFRVLKKFRVAQFLIRHFPELHCDGVYYIPAHEVLRDALRDKGITINSDKEFIKNKIKDLPEYKLCRIMHLNHRDFNSIDDNDFILDYIDFDFIKRVIRAK